MSSSEVIICLLGNDNFLQGGITVNTPISQSILSRFTLFVSRTDGFRKNIYLDSNTSNQRFEGMFRSKLRFYPRKNYIIDINQKYNLKPKRYRFYFILFSCDILYIVHHVVTLWKSINI